MTVGCRLFLTAALVITWCARPANAQTLADARVLYAGAAYADALDVLDAVDKSTADIAAVREALQYRALCLLALGRRGEAEQTVAQLVSKDPLYAPNEVEAPPQLRELFKTARAKQLPALVRSKFAAAREAFARQRSAEVAADFDAVLALLDVAEVQSALGADGVADMRTLATGFRDLARTPATTPASPAVADTRAVKNGVPPTPNVGKNGITAAPNLGKASIADAPNLDAAATAPPPGVDAIFDSESPGVVPPATVRQQFPGLRAAWNIRASSKGLLELVIDRDGRVESTSILRPFHPLYDPLLLQEARLWRYTPATRNGVPVRFRKLIEVVVAAK
jgi:hypothetical protein